MRNRALSIPAYNRSYSSRIARLRRRELPTYQVARPVNSPSTR